MTDWEKFDIWYSEHGWKYVSSREGAYQVWRAASKQLRQRVQELEEDRDKWRMDCSTYCDAMHKREAEILSLQTERDHWKQVAQNNHDRLVDVQAELELSDALQRDKVAKLTAERDKATQYWQIAEGRCDALMKERDELTKELAVLKGKL